MGFSSQRGERNALCLCHRCRKARTPWSGQINQEAVDAIEQQLGIKDPVKIAIWDKKAKRLFPEESAGAMLTLAKGELGLTQDTHFILIHPSLDQEGANFAVCHELVHCYQHERDGAVKSRQMNRLANALIGYDDNPFEHEANRMATELNDRYKVAL